MNRFPLKVLVPFLTLTLLLGCKTGSNDFSFLKGAELVTTSSGMSHGKFRESKMYNLHGPLESVDETISLELSPQSGWGRREVGDLVEFEKALIRVVLTSGKVDLGTMHPKPGSKKDWATVTVTVFR